MTSAEHIAKMKQDAKITVFRRDLSDALEVILKVFDEHNYSQTLVMAACCRVINMILQDMEPGRRPEVIKLAMDMIVEGLQR